MAHYTDKRQTQLYVNNTTNKEMTEIKITLIHMDETIVWKPLCIRFIQCCATYIL